MTNTFTHKRVIADRMGEQVWYLCVAPDHTKARLDRAVQNLTIHEGKWAVCPAGLTTDHTWRETPGLQYDDLFTPRAREKT